MIIFIACSQDALDGTLCQDMTLLLWHQYLTMRASLTKKSSERKALHILGLRQHSLLQNFINSLLTVNLRNETRFFGIITIPTINSPGNFSHLRKHRFYTLREN